MITSRPRLFVNTQQPYVNYVQSRSNVCELSCASAEDPASARRGVVSTEGESGLFIFSLVGRGLGMITRWPLDYDV